MHELALADAVVQVAARHAGERRVTRVELSVGHLRQVVPDALTFAFSLVAEGTVVQGAELVMRDVPVVLRCRGCGTEGPMAAFPMACERCGGLDVDVTQGEELLVDALELEETEMAKEGMAHVD
jgi:hydrogenase nickel incorporation protein HypA/HybF